MPRRTIQQARSKNAFIRKTVDAAKARGHYMQDLVQLENGKWCSSCSCGWESHHFHTTRQLAAEISWHIGWAAGGETTPVDVDEQPATDGVSQPGPGAVDL